MITTTTNHTTTVHQRLFQNPFTAGFENCNGATVAMGKASTPAPTMDAQLHP
jgi:hypothetical protein